MPGRFGAAKTSFVTAWLVLNRLLDTGQAGSGAVLARSIGKSPYSNPFFRRFPAAGAPPMLSPIDHGAIR